MKTTININDTVICRLTKDGLNSFCKHYSDLGINPENYVKMHNRGLAENQIKIQLWELMQIFGNQMCMGKNKLVVEKVC